MPSKPSKKRKPGESQRELQHKPRAPRQVWLVIEDDREDGWPAYKTFKAAKANAPPNAIILGPAVMAERVRQG